MHVAISHKLIGPIALGVWALTACASSPNYIGNWAHQSDRNYVGLALEKDGTCAYVVAVKIDLGRGQFGSTGGGHLCSYEAKKDTLVISEVWDYGSKTKHKLPEPILVRETPDGASLIVSRSGESYTLHRVWKIAR